MPGESLLVGAARATSDAPRVKDGCAPQGQCGCCTVLVDGDPRVACVTPVARVAGPVGHDASRPRPGRARAARRTRSSRPAARSAASARPGSSCGPRRCGRTGRDRTADRRPRARRPPVPLHRLADDPTRPSISDASTLAATVPSPGSGATSTRPHGGPRSRAACTQRVGPRSRSATAGSPTTRAPATRWSPSRCRPGRRPARRGGRAPLGRRRVAASRRAARRGRSRAGARRSTPRAAARRCRRAPDGGVAARDRLGRARVPRARRVVVRARGRAGIAARQRRRLRRQGRRRSRPPRPASWPTGSAAPVRVVYSREDVVRLGPKRPPIAATAVVARRRASRSTAMRRRARRADAGDARSRLRPAHRRVAGRRATVPGPPTSTAPAGLRRSPSARCSSRARSTRPASTARSSSTTTAPRPCSSTRAPWRRGGAVAGARVIVDPATGALAGRGARRRRRPARRRRAALVLRRRRAHGAGVGADRRARRRSGDRRGARPHDPLVRRDPGRRTCRRSRSTIVDDAGSATAPPCPTRSSPRLPPRRGTPVTAASGTVPDPVPGDDLDGRVAQTA